MITYVKGKLVEKNPTYVVIDCGGMGYFIHISLHTYSQIPDKESVRLFTHYLVREDSHSLFGFFTQTERAVFRLLISVSGVGAATARVMLSSMSPEEIQQAIALNNATLIQSVKGIGTKTAQRIIIELRDKILKTYDMETIPSDLDNTTKEEALSALDVLGFSRKQTKRVVDMILRENTPIDVENLIKQALKKL